MPRALSFFLTIVAAFPLRLAAAPPFVDAPTTTRIVELAASHGLDAERDRATFMPELARLLFPRAATKPLKLSELWSSPGPSVPVPLDAEIWGRVVFRTVVPPEQLVMRILADQRAAMLCRGLAALDDDTLSYLAAHPALITMLYERAATVFGAFGGNLRVRDGRVVPPGGDAAVPLWEAAARASVAAPERFLRAVFEDHEGRLAYLYDVIASADSAPAAFALGLWIPDEATRVERFVALFDACQRGYKEWQPLDYPFLRPLGDLAVLLVRMRVDPSGTPEEPSDRRFWARALDVPSGVTGPSDIGHHPIDAAWIVGATSDHDMYTRSEQLDQLAFGQRVFLHVEAIDEPAAGVIGNFRQFRMLLLALERMGIRSTAIYVAALQRAETVMSVPVDRRFWALAQYQGALAILGRMHRSRTLSDTQVEALVTSLLAVPLTQGGEYRGALAQWVRMGIGEVLGATGTWEERVAAVMAGRSDDKTAARIFWEGQSYRLDLALAERQRLAIVRRKQGGHTIDLALAVDGIGRALQDRALTLEEVRAASRDLETLLEQSGSQLRRPAVNVAPPGVAMRDAAEAVRDALDDLVKITRPADVRRAARIGTSLQELSDIILGHALVSLAYAADIGDPDSAALLAGNVALRHDFGLGRRDGEGRKVAWVSPRQDFRPGVPWHIVGSILGLDIALAPLSLRRMDLDRPINMPTLSSIEREGLAVGVILMDAQRLTDADRDAIAEAIGRGRVRVDALREGRESLETVVDLLGLDGWRRRELGWAIDDTPDAMASQFSLLDLLTLGGGAGAADIDAWGTPAIHSEGCPCSKLPGVRSWRALEGRAQVPMMAATMSDLNLAVAMILRDLNLPAALARPVLSVGMPDFIDELSVAGRQDWRSLSRQAQRLRRQRVEDYVSVAAAVNGPLVPEEPGSTREP